MKCETCKFWFKQPDDYNRASECRRYPPVVTSHVKPQEVYDNQHVLVTMPLSVSSTEHPRTSGDHWCGEYAWRG
jgi:hypothetical protein